MISLRRPADWKKAEGCETRIDASERIVRAVDKYAEKRLVSPLGESVYDAAFHTLHVEPEFLQQHAETFQAAGFEVVQ